MTSYQEMQSAIDQVKARARTAQRNDEAEVYLVLNSSILTQMECTYEAAHARAMQHRNQLWSTIAALVGEIENVQAYLATQSQCPERIHDLARAWNAVSGRANDTAGAVQSIAGDQADWRGVAAQAKQQQVTTTCAAAESYAQLTSDAADVIANLGPELFNLLFGTVQREAMTVYMASTGVERAPWSGTSLFGLFSRSDQIIPILRGFVQALQREITPETATWTSLAQRLAEQFRQLAQGSDALPASGWPRS